MENKEKELSQELYLSLKTKEEAIFQDKKDRETSRALKVAWIFVVISLSFSMLVLAFAFCLKVLG